MLPIGSIFFPLKSTPMSIENTHLFAIIFTRKRELIALLLLSFGCLVTVLWLFLTVPRVGLQCLIVVFPDHTHLLLKGIKLRNR